MTLKTKGGHTPKAGPKHKAAKTEEDRIRAAVEEHGRRGQPRAKRKSSRVTVYNFKEAEVERKRAVDAKTREDTLAYSLREPGEPTAFDLFRKNLSEDAKPFAMLYFQMQCEHGRRTIAERYSMVDGNDAAFAVCDHCGAAFRLPYSKWQEWINYCPDGFDMIEWADMYSRDKSMWQFIHDEVLAELAEGVIADGT